MASSPLTEKDLKQLNEALKILDQGDEMLTRAHQAGIDVSDQAQKAKAARARILQIKQAFFPGR